MKRYFVTGTDTDAGKTLVSATLLLKAQQQGLTTFGLKPVAAGCETVATSHGPQWQNEDAQLLRQYSSEQQPYAIHNPVALQAAIAPHIAAQQENRTLTCDALITACQPAFASSAQFQLVEGAGGWLVPLNTQETLADFATAINAGIILVVGLRLGCINHALLSASMIQHSGARLVGWVANSLSDDMDAQADNLAYLQHGFARQGVPLLGHTPYVAAIDRSQPEQLQLVADSLLLPDDE